MERLDSWYEPEDQYECDCGNNSDKNIESAKDFMEAIVEMMYSKKELNMDDFEGFLEEVCAHLDIDFPLEEIQIKRK